MIDKNLLFCGGSIRWAALCVKEILSQYVVSKYGAIKGGEVSAARRSSLLLCGGVDFGDWACPEGFFEALLGRPWLSAAFSSSCCFYIGFPGLVEARQRDHYQEKSAIFLAFG
jgi:hypothetical protein